MGMYHHLCCLLGPARRLCFICLHILIQPRLCLSADSCDSSFPLMAPVMTGPDGPDSNGWTRVPPGPKTAAFLSQSSNARLHDITAWGMNWHNSCVWKVTRLTRRDWVVFTAPPMRLTTISQRGRLDRIRHLICLDVCVCVCVRCQFSYCANTKELSIPSRVQLKCCGFHERLHNKLGFTAATENILSACET